MMRRILLLMGMLCAIVASASAQKVTVNAVNQPAAVVFRSLIEQTGKNFVYSTELLQGMKVTVKVKDKPLKKVLSEIFAGTDIEYKIKGQNVVLKRKAKKETPKKEAPKKITAYRVEPEKPGSMAAVLEDVVVVSRLEAAAVETSEIGAKKVTASEVRNTPVLFGEADVIKALQMQPGVSSGVEGMAGMYVHGGNADENLYMLENVPLYQVNHFAGLFSAFNTEIIRYIDFFKSSIPAKYDGRLSSFMDVRLQNGNKEGHHGSARLGLTSGAFNLSGPIGEKTTYLVGLRRSWYDLLSAPAIAIVNSKDDFEKITGNYYFSDFNASVKHRFSPKLNAFASMYFGDDKLKTGAKDKDIDKKDVTGSYMDDAYSLHWGNLMVQTGMNYRFNPDLSAEFTAAYTRFFTDMKYDSRYVERESPTQATETRSIVATDNNINDWIFRGDFDWRPNDNNRVRYGANYVRHSFLPARNTRKSKVDGAQIESTDSTWAYRANEVNAYIEDDWKVSDKFRMNAGLHASLFCINGKANYGISPRLSMSYNQSENLAIKAAYSRTTQYVHQLNESYLSLPTDQWIPITGNFKPQTADKVSVGGYWQTEGGTYAVSVEGYYKWMNHLIDYRDEYYLRPPLDMWNAQLCSGKGTAKGVDLKVEKVFGKVTGHVAYSLAWSDRTFADKNGGKTFPSKFDNRHTINVLVNWKVNNKVQLNASWTGHSGNRFTLLSQVWDGPLLDNDDGWRIESPLRADINNYQLPFYHRLDLSCVVNNRRGYWTFGLYNAYNHLNTVAIKRGYKDVKTTTTTPDGQTIVGMESERVFKKVKLLPIIPSISYTWQF